MTSSTQAIKAIKTSERIIREALWRRVCPASGASFSSSREGTVPPPTDSSSPTTSSASTSRHGPIALTHTHTFTQHHVDTFCHLTNDTNPIHKPSSTAQTIVPGILSASLFPSLISKHYPGSIYVSQTLTFRRPIPVNQPVHVHLESIPRTRGGLTQFSSKISLVMARGARDEESAERSLRDREGGCFKDTQGLIAVEGIAVVKLGQFSGW